MKVEEIGFEYFDDGYGDEEELEEKLAICGRLMLICLNSKLSSCLDFSRARKGL